MAEWSADDLRTVALSNQKSVYVGSGAPGTAYDGQCWVDVSTDPPVVKFYDLTNTQWMEFHPTYYETQSGGWASPSVTPVTNGTLVVVYNSTQTDTRLYFYSNGAWDYLDTSESPVQAEWTRERTYSDLAGGGTVALNEVGIYTIVAVSSDIRIDMDITSNGVGYTQCIECEDVCSVVSDGTNVQVRNNEGVNPRKVTIYKRSLPGGVTYASAELASGATQVLPAGLISICTDDSDIDIEYDASTWTDGGQAVYFGWGMIASDGTNIRLKNDGGAAHNYAWCVETT